MQVARHATARALSPFFTVITPCRLRGRREPAPELALEHGLAEGRPAPITSPVERISGPRMGSTPGNLLNGNTASLTLKYGGTITSPPLRTPFCDASVCPTMQRAGDLGQRLPVALETKGTVREARGFTSST